MPGKELSKEELNKLKKYFRNSLTNPQSFSIYVTNLVPILGVIFMEWDILYLIFIYWAESLMIGAFNVLKILIAQGETKSNKGYVEKIGIGGRTFIAGFFTVHFGFFCYVQISILLGIFNTSALQSDSIWGLAEYLFSGNGGFVALGVLFGNHLYFFINEYLIKGEYKTADPGVLMFVPYVRIFVQQFAAIFGGIFVSAFNLPILLLILLQILKTIGDFASRALDIAIKNKEYDFILNTK